MTIFIFILLGLGATLYVISHVKRLKHVVKNTALAKAFLAANQEKTGVKTTASGLQYLQLAASNSDKRPVVSDTVTVHYHGKLLDGTVFDSSVARGEPIDFALNQVIKGWTEGLQLMTEGEKLRLFIPSELAYGKRNTGSISGGSLLIFDVELLSIN